MSYVLTEERATTTRAPDDAQNQPAHVQRVLTALDTRGVPARANRWGTAWQTQYFQV